jgi:carbonic anhydrase
MSVQDGVVQMSAVKDEVIQANVAYAASFGEKARLALPPARGFLILTCMDARLDPAEFAGLAEGDAHVVRNAGGRATDDAIRSLVISHKLLGTKEWFVIHHTDCGMEYFKDDELAELLAGSLETAELTKAGFRNAGTAGGSSEGRYMRWLSIRDQAESVVEDVHRIRSHPLVNPAIPIYGYIFDVKTGRLNEVTAATEVGRPRS